VTGSNSWKHSRWIPWFLLAAILACHWAMLLRPFLSTEDLPHALGNPGIRDWSNLRHLFSRSYFEVFWEGSYHPLYTLFAFVNHALFGFEPFGMRLLKAFILWGNALLLSRLGRKELGTWAWAAGFFYALQPFHSNTAMLDVKDELVTLFCLLGLTVHRRSDAPGPPWRQDLALGACGALALASKETGIVFPALLLAMDFAEGGIRRKRDYGVCAVLTLLYAAFRIAVLGAGQGASLGYSEVDNPADIAGRLSGYAEGLTGLSVPLFACLIGYTLWKSSPAGRRFALGCLAWMAVGILPVSGLIPIQALSRHLGGVEFGVALRYLILPGVGYAWLLSLALRDGFEKKKPALALVPILFCSVGLKGLVSPERWLPSYPGSDCSVQDGKLTGGKRCVAGMTQILLSLPLMKARFPGAYAHYRELLAALLGGREPAVEDYFGGMLAEPCRTAHFLRRSRTGDFEKVWAGIEADRDSAAPADGPSCGPWTWAP